MVDSCCDKVMLFNIKQSSNKKQKSMLGGKKGGQEQEKGKAAEPKFYICLGRNRVKRGV